MTSQATERGFTLIEALIASAIFAAVVIGLAQLLTIALTQSARARDVLIALTLAQSKLEYLRSLAWEFDVNGARVSSGELATTPLDSHSSDEPPYVETLDRFGAPVADDSLPFFTRRWSIAADEADPDTLLFRVCVFSARAQESPACVWTARTRRP
jgi:prepilin-type N-terminal cleavage/methylation domain-containing protein